MRKYKKIIMLGLIVIFAVIFWEKAGILSSNKNYFSSFSVTPSKEEIIAQTRSLAEVVVVSAYDEFIVDTITYLVQNILDTDGKQFKSQNLVKIKGNTKASVPIKELTVFQIVVNEDSIAIRLPKYGCSRFLNANKSVDKPILPVDSKIIVLIDEICLAKGSTRSTKPIDISFKGIVNANPLMPLSLDS